jgi:hypothetical protein
VQPKVSEYWNKTRSLFIKAEKLMLDGESEQAVLQAKQALAHCGMAAAFLGEEFYKLWTDAFIDVIADFDEKHHSPKDKLEKIRKAINYLASISTPENYLVRI